MLGEGPRPPRAHAGRGWAPPLTAPLTPVTWPAPCTTCSCGAKTAVHGPPQSLGASGNACASFRPCPPCPPSPASRGLLPAWGSQSTGAARPRCSQLGFTLFLGSQGESRKGKDCGTEVLPGWSGSGPQIRGPGRPSDSVANHRHESLPGTRAVFMEILPQMHPPSSPPSSLRGRAWPTPTPPGLCTMQGTQGCPT